MTAPERDPVRDGIQALRTQDEARVPGFDSILERPRRARALDPRRITAVALAAGVMLVAGTAITLAALRPPRLVVPREVIALSTWRPMTDALLGDTRLLRDTPRLGESYLPLTAIDPIKEQ
jgi:hypothetical protein